MSQKVIKRKVSPPAQKTLTTIKVQKRDFDTHLTQVFHGMNKHPYIYERASNPDFDQYRSTIHRKSVDSEI